MFKIYIDEHRDSRGRRHCSNDRDHFPEDLTGLYPKDAMVKMNIISGSGVVRTITCQSTTGRGHPVGDVGMGRGTRRVTWVSGIYAN
ncbi:hypothetical protein DPMN_026494 [Dreissena polymorpha]|uniref:Uncharacterized protein n=1 Tax=Dreissena polymorpha TaxID=45954 RepID=A0A9D4REM2_DREPO|nr:hypothetical protein DPMN_026494 [Dreissena polymorpha]